VPPPRLRSGDGKAAWGAEAALDQNATTEAGTGTAAEVEVGRMVPFRSASS